jgi:hypothetical protein
MTDVRPDQCGSQSGYERKCYFHAVRIETPVGPGGLAAEAGSRVRFAEDVQFPP